MKHFFLRSSVFGQMFSRCVRFYIKKFTTCQILNPLSSNNSVFWIKLFESLKVSKIKPRLYCKFLRWLFHENFQISFPSLTRNFFTVQIHHSIDDSIHWSHNILSLFAERGRLLIPLWCRAISFGEDNTFWENLVEKTLHINIQTKQLTPWFSLK